MASDGGAAPQTGDVEVDGRSVDALLDGVAAAGTVDRETAESVLAVHGIGSPDPEQWYPLSSVLGALDRLASNAGHEAVTAAGRGVGHTLAGRSDTVPEAMTSLDETHDARHRGDVGGYRFRQIGDTDGRVECDTRYPCAFDRGVVEGVAAAADVAGEGFVFLAEVGRCREDGGVRCTYELSW